MRHVVAPIWRQQLPESASGANFRVNSPFPMIATDPTDASRVFVSWFACPTDGSGHADVYVSASLNGGGAWSPTPVRVNDDPGNGHDQFFPWLVVDDTGQLRVMFGDDRLDTANPGGRLYDVFLAASINHGASFGPNVRVTTASSHPFSEGDGSFIGDYFGMAACGTPVWTDTRSGNEDIYASSLPDGDADCVSDAVDNCSAVSNPSQQNTTKFIDNGPGLAGDDGSVPLSHTAGDACSADADADGLPNAQDSEPLGVTGSCVAFSGSSDAHPNPASGDVTNDDNGNGNAAALMGNDAADNGPSSDTDNDGVLDGVECILGKNPRSRASVPTQTQCANFAQPTPGVGPNTTTTDADADGIPAYIEYCKWGTSDTSTDSDGDAKGDCKEASDVDGNGVANFPGDTIAIAKAANALIGKTQDFDFDDNGVINFPGDAINHAKRTSGVIPCL